MTTLRSNAQRLLQCFETLRQAKTSAAFGRLSQFNLSLSHLRALHLLAPDKTLAMKDLAEQLQITPPSLTAITQRLVQTGLVQRHRQSDDSRVVLVSLTEEGRQLFAQLYEEQLSRMEELLQGLAPDEQRQFVELLERAVRALRVGQAHKSVPPKQGLTGRHAKELE